MNLLVIYPGRFHPFHRGHKASYDWLTKKFGENNVYIVTSDVQNTEDSPFSYADKVEMMTKLGIPAGRIVKVKNPYRAEELTSRLSDEEKQSTALIFAVSAKDAERFSFQPKKDGSASYLQPLPDNLSKLKPMTKHGYVAITPTVTFRVKGANANSASAIRKIYQDGNDADRTQIITDLYGEPDKGLIDLFDKKLGTTSEEQITYGTPIVDGGITDGMTRESKINRARIQQLKERIQLQRQQNLDYVDEKNSH